jgi:hypothetical protein
MTSHRETFHRLMAREGSPVLTWVMAFFNEELARKLLGDRNVPLDCIPGEGWHFGASDRDDWDRKIAYARATGNFAIGAGWGSSFSFGHGGPGEFRNRLLERGPDRRLAEYETGVKAETRYRPHYYHHYDHPVKTAEDAAALRLPDAHDPARWEGVREEIAHYKAHGFVTYGNLNGFFSGIHYYLRKYDDLLADLILDPGLVDALLDKIGAFNLAAAEEFLARGADMLCFCDDLGSGNALLMSPALYRRFFKPWHAKLAALCRERGAVLHMHSHGNINEILDDLAEIGVGMLNPNDPEERMDLPALQERYGDRIVFVGGIGKYFFEWDAARQEQYFHDLTGRAGGGFVIMDPGGIPENVTDGSYRNSVRLLGEARRRA